MVEEQNIVERTISIAEDYRLKALALVLRQLESGLSLSNVSGPYPRLGRDIVSAIESTRNPRIAAGRLRRCSKYERVSQMDCNARLAPPGNGNRYLMCLRNHGVVAHGPFASIWII